MNNIIDEIKKQVKEISEYSFLRGTVNISQLFSILDKYQDQEDVYKKCWEELKAIIKEDEEPALFNLLSDSNRNSLKYKLKELEQKHNIKETK